MALIQVSFIGICVYLKENQPNAPANPAWGTRIVVPNASAPTPLNAFYDFSGVNAINPHLASLFVIGDTESFQVPLNGATVAVSSDDTVLNPDGVNCLPGLASMIPGVAPGPAATSRNPSEAACYFDFTAGTLNATALPQGAGSIVYTTQSANPTMTVTPFGGGGPVVYQLPAGDTVNIVILNLPESGENDNGNDFLLSYMVADAWPQNYQVPPPTACPTNVNVPRLLGVIHMHGDVGMGCSNSNLP